MFRLLAVVVWLAATAACAQDIVVSRSGPIKTLAEARDAARAERRAGRTGSITITVRAGTYYLPETLILGPEDSDTVWEAPHGEHPVISGGRALSGWAKGPGGVWSASAPGDAFNQLFVDGRRATRARTPNYGFFRADGPSSQDKPYELHYRGNDIKKEWADRGDVEVVAYLAWADIRMPIVEVDEANHTATLGSDPRPSNKEVDARYYIENAPDALDSPGEWYLDRAKHTVFYIPVAGEDMARAVVVAPTLERLVSLEGDPQSGTLVRNIVFRGLTFAYADWRVDAKGYADTQAAIGAPSALTAVGAVGFKIEHCTIAHSGGYALSLGRGSKNNSLLASKIFDMGAGGIRIGEPAMSANDAEQNYGNIVADNEMHDLGLVFASAVGICVLQSGRNQIIHNHVHDLFYTAISVGWTWGYGSNQSHENAIAFNKIHDVGKDMLSDMGGIYTLGEQPGSAIENNLIYNVSSFTYGGWGIYPDEGSSNILIENNIVYNCKSAGFHQHYGRDNIVRNNIFALNHEHELMRTRAEAFNAFTMENNIVYFDEGTLLGGNWGDGKFTTRHNFYFDTRGGDMNFAGKSFDEWQAMGQDDGSMVGDPLFVNAENYDFRLRAESPASKAGFQQIDMSTAGPRVRAGADSW